MGVLSDLRSLRDSFHLSRLLVRSAADLHSIASTLEAFRLHFEIKSVEERRAEARLAEDEAAKVEKNPDLLRGPSVLDMALDDLRERKRRGEMIDPEEVLAAAQAIEDDEDISRSVW